MKRLLAVLLALALLLGCAAAEAPAETPAEVPAETEAAPVEITSKNFPFYFGSLTEIWREDFPLYFLDGVEDLPYMNLADCRDMLLHMFNKEGKTGEGAYTLEMEILEGENRVRFTRENGFNMVFNFDLGQIGFQDYLAFIQPADAGYMEVSGFPETMNDQPFLLQRTKDRVLYGDVTILDLKEYGIRMVAQDGKYLVPVQTLSAFLLSDRGIGIYFNGEALYMNQIPAMSDPSIALQTDLALNGLLTRELLLKISGMPGTREEKINYLLEEVSKMSDKGREIVEQYKKNLESSLYTHYASVPKKERSQALIAYGFYELALELDCFYGLKEAHNIEDFRMFFLQNDVGNNLADPDATKADQAVSDLTQYWFDDGHSAFISTSHLAASDAAQNWGFSNTDRDDLGTMIASIKAQYPDAGKNYFEVGDTAYVTFNSFVATTGESGVVDYYELAEKGSLPSDTIGIIYNAHQQITRENSPIKKVVLDLSCNGGGMAPAAFFTMGWFLGEANYSYRDTFTGAQATHYFRADVNMDHQFDEKDTLAGRGLKLYCLISPQSFSCGNLVPWAFKASGMVTLLGRTSGGGSCVVAYNTTAWGTSYRYSGSKRLSFVKNGAYYDVDRGVEPDFIIDDYAHFYDREALTRFIDNLY